MTRRVAYDAALSVHAAWALEFAPVNVSVVFFQADGNEHFVIGSRSAFFLELPAFVAEVRETFPWRTHEHILPPETDLIWHRLFTGLGLSNIRHAPDMPDNKRMLTTQLFLSRVSIDSVSRPWDEDGNNALLIDSLNGYRVKELASHSDVFTMNVVATHEQYLTRAVEHYAAWHSQRRHGWRKPPDYRQHDRGVI